MATTPLSTRYCPGGRIDPLHIQSPGSDQIEQEQECGIATLGLTSGCVQMFMAGQVEAESLLLM